MTNAMVVAFGMAIGGTSLICYLLMRRPQNSQRKRLSSGDSSATDSSNYAGGDIWTMASWFGGHHSVTDSSGNPCDFGGGDSGGSGDGGGGDGGGGGD